MKRIIILAPPGVYTGKDDHPMSMSLNLYNKYNNDNNPVDKDFYQKNIMIDGRMESFEFTIPVGQEECIILLEVYCGDSDACILPFSFFDDRSCDDLIDRAKSFRRAHEKDENPIIFLASYDSEQTNVYRNKDGRLTLENDSDNRPASRIEKNTLEKAIKEIKPTAYIEVDVVTGKNVKYLFEEVAKAILSKADESSKAITTKKNGSWFKKILSSKNQTPVQALPNSIPSSNATAVAKEKKLAASSTVTPTVAQSTVPTVITSNLINNNSNNAKTQTTGASLLTNAEFKPHLTFLSTLSEENLRTLAVLEKQGGNLNQVLPTLTMLQSNQEDLTKRLTAVETQTGLDAQTQAELSYIQNNEKLYGYYQTLKMLLGQTFLAAKVIASGKVDGANSIGMTVANGMSNIAGALCPPAKPFLSFAATVVDVTSSIASYRAMQTLSAWAEDLDAMNKIAETLARQLAIAQEYQLNQELKAEAKTILKSIQDKCILIIERVKSGKTLTIEKSQALLDANELLNYMKENSKPKNTNVAKCVAILLSVIMGEDYTHAFTHIVAVQQASVSTAAVTTTTVMAVTTQSYMITREEWEAMQKKTAEAERKAEEAQRQLEILRKQTTQSNPNSSHDVGNGPFVQRQLQETVSSTKHGAVPASTVFNQRLDEVEKFMSIIGPQWAEFQEQQKKVTQQNNDPDTEQMRKDLFQAGNTSYQQMKK